MAAYIEQPDEQDTAPTLAEFLAMPYEERNRQAKRAPEQSQMHEDLEGWSEADINDGASAE